MIILNEQYPGQTSVDPRYPQGKPRNEETEGDGSGFPLEEKWVQDVLGFMQALVLAADIEPSGTPDNILVSQCLTAIRRIAVKRVQTRLTPPKFSILPTFTYAKNWRYADDGANVGLPHQFGNVLDNYCVFPLIVPYRRVTIPENGIRVTVEPFGSHTSLPEVMPRADFYEAGSYSLQNPLAYGIDTTASVGAYNNEHTFTLNNEAIITSPDDMFFVRVRGEYGDDSYPGLQIKRIEVDLEPNYEY